MILLALIAISAMKDMFYRATGISMCRDLVGHTHVGPHLPHDFANEVPARSA